MNLDVEAYAWAEQMNRQRLSAQSTRGWLADAVSVSRRREGSRTAHVATIHWIRGTT